ncbi:hypothetical protein ACFLVH_05485 [Chloroflexota bacterium]
MTGALGVIGLSGKTEVSAGEYIQIAPRAPVTIGWHQQGKGAGQFDALCAIRVYNPRLVNIVQGHRGVTASHRVPENTVWMRKWSQKVGIPQCNMYDLGRQGIEHVLSAERCWALPGEVFVEIVNGHTSALGALGAFAFTLSY